MSEILNDDLEKRLMDIHFSFKTQPEWILKDGKPDIIPRAMAVDEAKKKLL